MGGSGAFSISDTIFQNAVLHPSASAMGDVHYAKTVCKQPNNGLLIGNAMVLSFNSKVFIILSPSAIEASHSWRMRQFELYAIITQPIALMSVAACQASGRLCLFA